MNSVEEIQSINHHMRLALDQVGEGILITEAESMTPMGPRVVFANRAVTEFSGFQTADILGQPLGLLFDRDFLIEVLRRLPGIGHASEPFPVRKDLHHKDGSRETYDWTILPVKNTLGKTVNFTIRLSPFAEDLEDETPAAKLEEALNEDLAKSRLESLQIVSSGIAHDFRNGLVATKLALDLVRSQMGNRPDLIHLFDDADLSLEANAELATQMLEFNHGEDSKVRVMNLHGLLQKTARMSTIGNNVTPELSVQEHLWDVEIDAVQMRQVFQNIIINGCQAMPNGGPMHISARNANIGDDNTFSIPTGDYVVIGIRDRGCGIPKDALAQVFDPYFSTKPQGTGIGLASCRQIVERHQGKIMVESVENVGTEFIIFLRAATNQTANPDPNPNPVLQPNQVHARATQHFLKEPTSSKRRILIVDDDQRILKLASTIVKHIGHDAACAIDGEAALELVRASYREANSYDVILMDLNLPRIGGYELMNEIRRIDPSVRVILSSGDGTAPSGRFDEWDGVLPKPYGMDAMKNVIENISNSAHHTIPQTV